MIQTFTDLIIRPARQAYSPSKDLGPPVFSIDNQILGHRTDFKVTNRRNQRLECSLFHRKMEREEKLPLMIFCHGNTGNRTSSYGVVYSMLRAKVNVITFDFAGCGLSEGTTISLGYFEQNDIADVLDYSIKQFSFIDKDRIGIWGRCMGAVSALLFTSHSNAISLLVLDSPYPDLPSLLRDYVQRVKIIPKWAEDYIFNKIRDQIKEQGNYDILDVAAISRVHKCRVPALFIHGSNDRIIPMHLFKRVFEAYPAAKEYIELKASHNDPRPEFVYEKVKKYLPKTQTDRLLYSLQINSFLLASTEAEGSLMSLDTLKFQETMTEINEDGLIPVKKALESILRERKQDCESGVNTKSGNTILQPSIKENQEVNEGSHKGNHMAKNGFLTLGMTKTPITGCDWQHSDRKRLEVPDTVLEESEISDDLLDSGEVIHKEYLEISYIENASKVTFDSFRNKNKRMLDLLDNTKF